MFWRKKIEPEPPKPEEPLWANRVFFSALKGVQGIQTYPPYAACAALHSCLLKLNEDQEELTIEAEQLILTAVMEFFALFPKAMTTGWEEFHAAWQENERDPSAKYNKMTVPLHDLVPTGKAIMEISAPFCWTQ